MRDWEQVTMFKSLRSLGSALVFAAAVGFTSGPSHAQAVDDLLLAVIAQLPPGISLEAATPEQLDAAQRAATLANPNAAVEISVALSDARPELEDQFQDTGRDLAPDRSDEFDAAFGPTEEEEETDLGVAAGPEEEEEEEDDDDDDDEGLGANEDDEDEGTLAQLGESPS